MPIPCQRGWLPEHPSSSSLRLQPAAPAALKHFFAQICDHKIDWLVSQFSDCTPSLHILSSEVGSYVTQWLCWDKQFPSSPHCIASVLSPSLGEALSLGSGFLTQTGGCLLLFSICSWQRESVQLPLLQLTARWRQAGSQRQALTSCSHSKWGLWCPELCQLQEKCENRWSEPIFCFFFSHPFPVFPVFTICSFIYSIHIY